MNGFIVSLENKPGSLAQVTEAIAAKGIDITAFGGVTCGGDGTLLLLTNDEAGTRRALADAGCDVREVEVVSTAATNRPGELAKIARKLADAGVNIDAAIPTGMSSIAIATDDPVRARSILGSEAGVGSGTR